MLVSVSGYVMEAASMGIEPEPEPEAADQDRKANPTKIVESHYVRARSLPSAPFLAAVRCASGASARPPLCSGGCPAR